MATVIKYLELASVKDLLRALNSDKDYLHFDINHFNAGTVVYLKNTINYKNFKDENFMLENDDTMKFYIAKVLSEKDSYEELAIKHKELIRFYIG